MHRSRRLFAAIAIAALVVAACGANETTVPPQGTSPATTTSSPTRGPSDVVRAEARDGQLGLVFELEDDTFRAGEPIDGQARLEIASGGADLVGSGSGLVGFEFREVGGRRRIGPVWTSDCHQYRLEAGTPIVTGILKSGGFSADDPDAAFYRAFFAEPLVRLPAGRWEIAAVASFVVGECGNPEHSLRASITVTVEP